MPSRDDLPNRKIGGLSPAPKFDARVLIKAQRPKPETQPTEEVKEPTPTPPAPAPARKAAQKTTPKTKVSDTSSGSQISLTVYVPASLRLRTRALYRATSHLEGDRTFSHMVEKMLVAAVEEREQRHNGGKPFTGDTSRLSSGRPLSDD